MRITIIFLLCGLTVFSQEYYLSAKYSYRYYPELDLKYLQKIEMNQFDENNNLSRVNYYTLTNDGEIELTETIRYYYTNDGKLEIEYTEPDKEREIHYEYNENGSIARKSTFIDGELDLYSSKRYTYENELLIEEWGFGENILYSYDEKNDLIQKELIYMSTKYILFYRNNLLMRREYYKEISDTFTLIGYTEYEYIDDQLQNSQYFEFEANVPIFMGSLFYTYEDGLLISEIKFKRNNNDLIWEQKKQYFYSDFGHINKEIAEYNVDVFNPVYYEFHNNPSIEITEYEYKCLD